MFVRVTLLVVSDFVTLTVVLVVVEVSLARVAKAVEGNVSVPSLDCAVACLLPSRRSISSMHKGSTYLCPSLWW